MASPVDNTNVSGFQELIPPGQIKRELPVDAETAALIVRTRQQIRDVVLGQDTARLVLIVGPCSIHDPEAAFEYAARLRQVADRMTDAAIVLMRAYFEKPRTNVGWKGLVNDPTLDGSCDVLGGLRRARETLLQINRLGMPCASEALDPITPHFLSDLLSWASIGARTTESQTHREMASGLSMPIGFKNGTDGSLEPAVNALISAGAAHSFLGINGDGHAAVVKTTGNPVRHVILRGGSRPNYHQEDVEEAAQKVHKADPNLRRPVMVDTSHGNSNKDYTRQARVCRDVVRQFQDGQRCLMGLLVESNLVAGKQQWQKGATLKYGQSITDACMGWEETEALLEDVASRVRAAQHAA